MSESQPGTTATRRVAVIGGDGIGPEVVAEALKVVAAAGVRLDAADYELGAAHYLRTGDVLPDATLEELRTFDAILLGAVGPPVGSTDVPNGLLERGLLLRLRFELDLYVNLRPFTGTPGAPAPDCDFVVIRENTEGTYAGEGGFLRKGTPQEVATQGSVNTRMGVERCVRFAFDLAARRPRQHLTLVHKTNVLTFAGDLWQRATKDVAAEFPGVTNDYNHVDAACIYLVEQPSRYDVIVTDNLFGDILTDLAGAIAGGIGFAASANLNPARTGPSLFEPVHGAAHDIAGTGMANPLAAIRSAALMLDHLGHQAAADRVTKAISTYIAEHPAGTPFPSTVAVGDAIAERLRTVPFTASEKIWMDGEFVDWDKAQIHVLTHSLHYGSGVFEGIRAYPTSAGVAVFRLTEHIQRLFTSAKVLMIDIPYTVDQLVDVTKELVRVNALDEGCYIRPIAYLGYGEMGLNPLPCPVNVSIAAWPWGTYLGDEGVANGIRLKVSSWQRHDPNAVPTAAKATGMYINSSLAKVEALKAGYDEAVLLAPDGRVSECTGENLFIVRGDRIFTPPTSESGALGGITQASVTTIAHDLGYEVVHEALIRTDLYTADEAFLSGTAAEVVPIREVDDRTVGDGRPGPITKQIQQTYFSAVRGEVDRYKDWLEHVR